MATKRRIKRRTEKYDWDIITQGGAWVPLNKKLFDILSNCEEVCFLLHLMDCQRYWATKKKLLNNGYFYATYENIKNVLNISVYKQRKIVKNLRDKHKLINTKETHGRQYFRINRLRLKRLLNKASVPSHFGYRKIQYAVFK